MIKYNDVHKDSLENIEELLLEIKPDIDEETKTLFMGRVKLELIVAYSYGVKTRVESTEDKV